MISNKAMTDEKMVEMKTSWSSIGKLHDGNFVQIILWENYLEKNLKIYWTTHNTLLQKTRCFGECSIVSLAQCGRAPVKLSLLMVQEGRRFESCMRLRKPTVSLWSFPRGTHGSKASLTPRSGAPSVEQPTVAPRVFARPEGGRICALPLGPLLF